MNMASSITCFSHFAFGIIAISLMAILPAQAETTSSAKIPIPFVKQMETAYHAAKFHQQQAIAFDLDLTFGNKKRMQAHIITATNSSWIKMVKSDGTTLLFDGKKVWLSPVSKNYKKARFDISIWQYFFMFPFKVSDSGAQWKAFGAMKYEKETTMPAAQLTFKSGTGDASHDRYVVYKNPQNLIAALGYLVAFGGKTVAEAEKNLHAIVYSDYKQVNGIPFARQWTFHHWSQKTGLGAVIGHAEISHIQFVKKTDVKLQKPVDATEVKMPTVAKKTRNGK